MGKLHGPSVTSVISDNCIQKQLNSKRQIHNVGNGETATKDRDGNAAIVLGELCSKNIHISSTANVAGELISLRRCGKVEYAGEG